MISLGVLYVIGLVIEDNKVKYQREKKYKTKNNQRLNVSKSKFITQVIEWCKQNLEHPKYHKYYPVVEVLYYKSKKRNGVYLPSNLTIKIFVNNHQTIDELVDTCIHEYVHYLQMPFQTNQVEYNKFNKTRGYLKNPYEIEARERAAFYTPKCIKELKRLGYIL
jgi:hypothetical protein